MLFDETPLLDRSVRPKIFAIHVAKEKSQSFPLPHFIAYPGISEHCTEHKISGLVSRIEETFHRVATVLDFGSGERVAQKQVVESASMRRAAR